MSSSNIARRTAALKAPSLSAENAANLFSPAQQEGLKSLLQRIYKKPVELNITPISKPHLNAEILGDVVVQRLKDRQSATRKVIREAAWKAQLPNERMVTAMRQAKMVPPRTVSTSAVQQSSAFASHCTSTSRILASLNLSQVSSVSVSAGGRLTKRLTANRAQSKSARRGATSKGGSFMVRGFVKSHESSANVAGKRRIGAYGVRIKLGHS